MQIKSGVDTSKTLFWGAIFGIIIAMLTFDVFVFEPIDRGVPVDLKAGYTSMGIHFAVIAAGIDLNPV